MDQLGGGGGPGGPHPQPHPQSQPRRRGITEAAAAGRQNNPAPPPPPPPEQQQQLACPRCKSDNTKFCYYNNYSLTQPRYFCKTCRRYWTHGGTLRNVPVGGGSRKCKRPRLTDQPVIIGQYQHDHHLQYQQQYQQQQQLQQLEAVAAASVDVKPIINAGAHQLQAANTTINLLGGNHLVPPVIRPIYPGYYHGGRFVSSTMTTIQAVSQSNPSGFSRLLGGGGGGGGGLDLEGPLLQGFALPFLGMQVNAPRQTSGSTNVQPGGPGSISGARFWPMIGSSSGSGGGTGGTNDKGNHEGSGASEQQQQQLNQWHNLSGHGLDHA